MEEHLEGEETGSKCHGGRWTLWYACQPRHTAAATLQATRGDGAEGSGAPFWDPRDGAG